MASVATWEVDDVAAWIEQILQLPYGHNFKQAGVDGRGLVELDEEKLLSLGVDSHSDLVQLLSHIAVLRAQIGRQQIMGNGDKDVEEDAGEFEIRLDEPAAEASSAFKGMRHQQPSPSETLSSPDVPINLPRSGMPVAPVTLSYPRVGSPASTPSTPRGSVVQRRSSAAGGNRSARGGSSKPTGAQHGREKSMGVAKDKLNRGASGGYGQVVGSGFVAASHEGGPDDGGGSALPPDARQGHTTPDFKRLGATRGMPFLYGMASLSTEASGAGCAAQSSSMPASAPFSRLSTPRSMSVTPLTTPRTGPSCLGSRLGGEAMSRCSSTPGSKRGPSSAAAEGASLFLADQSRGAHFGSTARNLEVLEPHEGPGPAGYDTRPSAQRLSTCVRAGSPTKFGFEPRRTMECMFMRGSSGPGSGKYNPQHRERVRGGSISRASRWGSRNHNTGASGLPRSPAQQTPGPHSYKPNYAALSTTK